MSPARTWHRPFTAAAVLACALTVASAASAAFVGTNGRVSYNQYRYQRFQIYFVNPDGTDRRFNIIGDVSIDDPAYSPDGDQVAFAAHWVQGKRIRGQLGWENDDPNENGYEGMLVVPRSWGTAWDPTWSPDGSRLAFTSSRDGDFELYAAAREGGPKVQITSNRVPDVEPAWSPDGRSLAFTRRANGNWDIYVKDLVGGGVTRMTTSRRVEGFPSWSPDGSTIAFWGKGASDAELYTVDVHTRAVRQVTRNAVPDYDPAWSPDGTMLAFSSRRGGRWDIFRMNVSGGGLRNLSRDRYPDAYPDWQPRCHARGSEDVPSTLTGTDAAELLCSLAQGDAATGAGGNDALFGRDGDDQLDGGEGADVLVGGPGADTLTGGPGADLLNARDGAGGDVVNGDADDLCYADPGDVLAGCVAAPFLPGVVVTGRPLPTLGRPSHR
jgi:Tol biopolymer transport system component